ncbi:thymidylate synthase [Shimia thalassica]|uniref:thymidylate synthase n=1 Tax=Shimia thalassica TaxID=1715693 RepID=UPI001C08CAF9|nr:thymidylate synthase [Shimia thalassica]MBU2943977.1 thymidylate synthase [Shimia thalassica]MDO6483429.1 thymidylate synthase [Shimia thalassica]MDO6503488.1 thymidylate synthase [Shimia thalassica]MDO6798606.1 thymidylate synthase [Shimia thalassica]MDP2520746.1 thymidylate synthase [Shimia thalassica]
MIRSFVCMAAMASLTACGGSNPFAEETDDDTEITVPEELAGNLKSVSYNATDQTLSAEIYALDSTPVTVVYARDSARDIGTYEAYSVQEDSLDRFFVAMVGESQDGSVQAGFVGDGGQFNRVLQGAYYERNGTFDAPPIGTGPAAGQVSYAGDYAGILNGGPSSADAPNVDSSILPGEPYLVSGQVFLNANFADMAVNGGVYDRQIVLSTPFELEDISLIVTDIAADGSFFGDVEVHGVIENDKGDYGGVFGGSDAAAVAGIISMSDFTENLDDETEYGFFVLTQCGLDGDAAICDNAAP